MDGFRALIAAGATAICCLVWALRSSKSRSNSNSNSNSTSTARGGLEAAAAAAANGEMAVGGEKKKAATAAAAGVVGEVAAGCSMMEQLVPEITTHALSYLDYTSLCRLSMTNSAMRKAANDDGAWKALYHKDFTVEQDNIIPSNGWKAYYAATKAIVSVNAEFFNILRERSLQAMGRFWLNADYVKCIHASGELFTGYNAVMDRWSLAFTWGQAISFQLRDVRARVFGEVAWVSMKAYVDVDSGPFVVTNVYEFRGGRWYMVHHHMSIMFTDGDPGP